MCLYSVKPEEKPREKVIPCQTKNRWILSPDAKLANNLDRQAAEELMKGEICLLYNRYTVLIIIIKFPYNTRSDWLKQHALSENTARVDDKLAFKFLLWNFDKFEPN